MKPDHEAIGNAGCAACSQLRPRTVVVAQVLPTPLPLRPSEARAINAAAPLAGSSLSALEEERERERGGKETGWCTVGAHWGSSLPPPKGIHVPHGWVSWCCVELVVMAALIGRQTRVPCHAMPCHASRV